MCTISKDELAGVVDEIFNSMAGMQLAPAEVLLHPDHLNGYIVSAVQIVGDWQGAVRLDTDLEMARQACARLLGVEAGGLSPNDIRDAAGELANMVGGSVKALLAPTSGLSLPSVVMGQNYEFSFPQGKVIQQASFTHDSGCLLISVVQKDGK
jgi:chemotaxis protein CheX